MQRITKFGISLGLIGILWAGWGQPVYAKKRASQMETSLLGIHLLATYHQVFARYGAPYRVIPAGVMLNVIPAVNNRGEITGGVLAVFGSNETPSSINRPNAGNGMPTAAYPGGGMPGYPGMPGSSPYGPYGPPTGMPGSEGPPIGGPSYGPSMPYGGSSSPYGMPSSPYGSSSPYGVPPGAPGSSSPYGIPGLPGVNQPAQQGNPTFAELGGYKWVYFYPEKELLYMFGFTPSGRVIHILEVGRTGGQPTSRGLRLGDSLKKVYELYGWPDSTEQQGGSIALIYNIKHHLQVNVYHNRVIAIFVMLLEQDHFDMSSFFGAAPNNPGGTGRTAGYPGIPGMPPGMPGAPSGYPGFPGAPGRPAGRPPLARPGLPSPAGGGGSMPGGAD
ncbi:hypothetical protein [Chthonomonas calidirosea]|uniref:hypothetical protein n=1 Tax=Chthonomonas calidirosea TaxID=454171 RepID=UPI0006EC9BAA|nr:hypothetical protein [Chthonomonas calidirosea]CEK18550.1 hypothetical protein CP488_02222 [Chthonomonas calidirosea]